MRKLFDHKRKGKKPAKGESSAAESPVSVKSRTVGLGIKCLYEPSDAAAAIIDIVFVHGLTGTSDNTWLDPVTGTYWPQDLLSCDIANARVLAFGYDADVVNFWNPTSQNRIGEHAMNLIGGLTRVRENSNSEQRNIIFVAHSLGGLVVQDALWSSKTNAEPHLQQVNQHTVGILFLGTPHHGADLAAWGTFGTRITQVVRRTNSEIVAVLRPGSEMLARIQGQFHTLLRQRKQEQLELRLTCFFEELPLPLVGKVVETHSASIPGYSSYSIHANHMDMTKFADNKDNGYLDILGELRRWVKLSQPPPGFSKTTSAIFMVPFERDPLFVERSETFNDIEEIMKTSNKVSLSGIGGVGKSQIAIEFCYRFRERRPSAHILWVHCSTKSRFTQDYGEIARKLQIPGRDQPDVDILSLVSDYLCEEQNNHWLLILDNADDSQIFIERSEATSSVAEHNEPLYKYIPRSERGTVLITTRDKRVGQRLTVPRAVVVLKPMGESEAEELLRSRLEETEKWNREDVKQLLEALEYLPLAITQAAAYISQNGITLPEYLRLLCTNDAYTQLLLARDLGDLRRDLDNDHSVIKTWKISFDVIGERNPLAAQTLCFMAMIDRQVIPRSLLPQDVGAPLDIIEALGVLLAFSLITSTVKKESYQLHRLVQLATQSWLETQGQTNQWQKRVILSVENLFPWIPLEDPASCGKLYPHAQKVLQYEGVAEERRTSLLTKMSKFDMFQGRYKVAQANCERALNVQQRLFGNEHPRTIDTVYVLAMIYCSLEHWKDAEKLLIPHVEARKKLYGKHQEDTLRAMNWLGWVYCNLGNLKEAEELLLSVLETSMGLLGAEHSIPLRSTGDLAVVYREQRRPKAAEKLAIKVLEVTERTPGVGNAQIIGTQGVLAKSYRDQGHFEKEGGLLKSMVEASATSLGAEHPMTIFTMHDLALNFWNQGLASKGIDLMKEVLSLKTRVIGPDHPQTAISVKLLDQWMTEVAEKQDRDVGKEFPHKADGKEMQGGNEEGEPAKLPEVVKDWMREVSEKHDPGVKQASQFGQEEIKGDGHKGEDENGVGKIREEDPTGIKSLRIQ